ncbi:MAG TPA: UDP-N-acetylmuramate dehydrogenase [Kofleriaceae bacterium]|nr:UDP-N-acetylmuramate dehydrogenase [Kofleriaceae bacterium]
MIALRDVPLAPRTTLGIGGPARRLVQIEDERELREVLASDRDVLVLGGGSNLVVGDAGFPGTVIQLAMRDVRFAEHGAVFAQAGAVWDDLVAAAIDAGLAGLECMSGIPGLVGATPMQNVGAYGQEVSDTITSVRAYDRDAGEVVEYANAACGFGYRTSAFRGSARWIVLGVAFALEPSELSRPIRYAELARALGIREGERAPLPVVRDAVIALRRGKGMVIDPGDPESRSAGSFFTNPIVAGELAPAGAPSWPQPDGRVKLSAAWLIERAGFAKGHARGRAAISRKHALALVNRGGATAAELLALAREIQDGVRDRFGIELSPEPVIVGAAP